MPASSGDSFVSRVTIPATANTARDGTGTEGTTIHRLATAEDRDVDLNLVRIIATGTVTAGVVRIFESNGASKRLVKEVMITATTPSASVETFVGTWQLDTYNEILWPLKRGCELWVATHNAEAFVAFAIGRYR